MKQNEVIKIFTDNKKVIGSYVNGNHRTILYEDGTKVKETGYYINETGPDGKRVNRWVDVETDHLTYEFPENMDWKITNFCEPGQDGKLCKYCHENSSLTGKHGDIKTMLSIVKQLQPGTEISLGGGNTLSHPDLLWLLQELKKQGVISNITVNQKHLAKNKDLLLKLVNEKLVNGIGVSMTDSSNTDDMKIIDMLGSNVIIHVIAGLFNEADIPFVRNRKIIVLGYKNLRRGHDHLQKEFMLINKNIEWLKKSLPILAFEFNTISFDDLGIEQVKPQSLMGVNDSTWNTLYQGSDTKVKDDMYNITCCTMFIDVPNMKVCRMSTAPLDMRHSFDGTENIRDLFKLSIKGWQGLQVHSDLLYFIKRK